MVSPNYALTKEDTDIAKEAALAMEKETQELVASDKELMAKVPNGIAQAGLETIKADFHAVEIHLGAVRQPIEKGDDLGEEIQAQTLKGTGLAVFGKIQCTIDTVRERNPTPVGTVGLATMMFDKSYSTTRHARPVRYPRCGKLSSALLIAPH